MDDFKIRFEDIISFTVKKNREVVLHLKRNETTNKLRTKLKKQSTRDHI